MRGRKLQLTGKRFGRLLVINPTSSIKGFSAHLCRCDCGNEKVVRSFCLTEGQVRSCGCLQLETMRRNAPLAGIKHGLSYTQVYRAWNGMVQRCYGIAKSTAHYRAKGVKVCSYLRESSANLLETIGHPKEKSLTLDRISSSDHYSCGKCKDCLERKWPLNIRWASRVVQGRNRSSNKFLTINGESHCYVEWAERAGLPRHIIKQRAARKEPVDRILRPVGQPL